MVEGSAQTIVTRIVGQWGPLTRININLEFLTDKNVYRHFLILVEINALIMFQILV
jgi:hypothetical protein